MNHCDVLILGGGPAGSTCARRLAAAGRDVVILDRREFPRDKTCAGWVTPQVVETLGLDLEEYGRGRTLQPITGFLTGVIGRRPVETHYGHIVSYGIRRCEFDHYLLQRCGARLVPGTALKSMERQGEGWLINGDWHASLLIGAGGHFCPVARELGARDVAGSSVVAAQEIEYAPPPDDLARCAARPEVPELFFCADLKGYGWCFRKGDFLNIGLGRTDSDQLSRHVQEFVEFLRERGSLFGDVPAKFHGHAYQLYERVPPRLVDDRVLLIGDAAGLAYPQSGEGIRPAVESGIIAADVVIDAAADYSQTRLAPYADAVRARFGPPRPKSAAGWLPAGWLQGLAAQLLSNRTFARNVVINRWFLHTQQPALAATERAEPSASIAS